MSFLRNRRVVPRNFMSHALPHRLTSMPALNTSTSATLVDIYPVFSVLWCFSLALTSMQAETSLPAFFCSSFHSNSWMTTHAWVLVKNAAWPAVENSAVIALKGAFRGIGCRKGLIAVITSIQKTLMTSSSELRTNLFLHSSIISRRRLRPRLYYHRQHRLLRYRSKNSSR